MEPKIVNCKCGEFIGIRTDKGLMIGNIIVTELTSFCLKCVTWIDYDWWDTQEIIFDKE